MGIEYYNAQVAYMNEVHKIRHDMQAHMVVLQHYLDVEEYDNAKLYLSKMKQHQNLEETVLLDTGNDLVNAILLDVLGSSKKNIKFDLEGMLPLNFCMDEYDICTLFSNLFSNATEACEKLEIKDEVISMRISETKEGCKIKVCNPIEWNIETLQGKIKTTKSDKKAHGFGVAHMIEVVKRYHGTIDFLVTEEYFEVEITL